MKKGKGKKKLKCEECGSTQVRLVVDEEGSWEPGEKPFWVCCECGEEVFGGEEKARALGLID